MRYLIEQKGFRLLAIEWQPSSGDVVESFLLDGNRTASIAASTLSVWSSQEDADFFSWLRTFNQAHPGDEVHFLGFDVQQPDVDEATLQTFFGADGGVDAPMIASPLSACDVAAGLTSAGLSYLGDFPSCNTALDGLDAYVSSNRATLVAATTEDRVERAELASMGLRAWQGEAFYYNSDLTKSYQSRDLGMADVFTKVRGERFSGVKTVVWAHNYHLRMAGADVTGTSAVGAVTMGTVLKQRLADAYFPIAQVGYDIGIDWPGVGCGPTGNAPAPSMAGQLNTLGPDELLVDLSFAGSATPFFIAGRAYPESAYELMVPADQYGALIFLRHSPKMTPLDWASCQ
jgi:erythromycin esterase-like protein